MKDEYSVDYSISGNEVSFLKGMIREYYKPEIERLKEDNEYLNKVNIELSTEKNRLNNIIKHVEDICESSIVSVNQILQDEKETKIVNGRCINRNEYQIVRLKAYRTKSKEILGRIKELKGSDE